MGLGGTECTWLDIGAALADMAGNGMTFGAKLLRACITKNRQERTPTPGGNGYFAQEIARLKAEGA